LSFARAAERRLKLARFPSLKTLETFDFQQQQQPSLNRMLVNQLMLGEYIESRESIILIGQPGTGKTHLATAFGIKACQQGKKVRFFRVSDLITQLLEAREERQLLRLKKSLPLLTTEQHQTLKISASVSLDVSMMCSRLNSFR
jgi:DNA replication protein DnaC